jgi:hypothetical protein
MQREDSGFRDPAFQAETGAASPDISPVAPKQQGAAADVD